VSRSIGDAYLKRPEFSLDPSFPRFRLTEPLGWLCCQLYHPYIQELCIHKIHF
ncbi:hypothetical protein MKW94_015185, partial [Papaver nudicaule]|nr:hypothetical protein [Papaver nudicaule]